MTLVTDEIFQIALENNAAKIPQNMKIPGVMGDPEVLAAFNELCLRNALEAVAPLIAKEVQERAAQACDDLCATEYEVHNYAAVAAYEAAAAAIRALDLTGDKSG